MSEFDEYIRQGEPGRKEKAAAWQTAIGLQDVDGLKPSEFSKSPDRPGMRSRGIIVPGTISRQERCE